MTTPSVMALAEEPESYGTPDGREPRVTGQVTRTMLLDTAERLFAEKGVDAVSLRQVGIAAGQRNTAAVKYHFGNREGLLRAIFNKRLQTINPARERLLDALKRDGRLGDARAVLEAYVLPLTDERTSSTNYVQLLAQMQLHPASPHPFELADKALRSSADRVVSALLRIPPLPSRAARTQRVSHVLGFVLHALATQPTRQGGPAHAYVNDVIDLGAAMLVVDNRDRENPRRDAPDGFTT